MFTLPQEPDPRPGLPIGPLVVPPSPAAAPVPRRHLLGAGHRPLGRTTEALFLVASHVFDELGYRRVEWKCNALDEPSRRAAERFGFTFEGLFRRAMIVRGRSRDTAWYSIIDEEWPDVKAGYAAWSAPSNFDAAGRQRWPLAARR